VSFNNEVAGQSGGINKVPQKKSSAQWALHQEETTEEWRAEVERLEEERK
jgi:hypothetical protein